MTYGLGNRCSIQLSYVGKFEKLLILKRTTHYNHILLVSTGEIPHSGGRRTELPGQNNNYKLTIDNFANKGNELLIYYKWKNERGILSRIALNLIYNKKLGDFLLQGNLSGNF